MKRKLLFLFVAVFGSLFAVGQVEIDSKSVQTEKEVHQLIEKAFSQADPPPYENSRKLLLQALASFKKKDNVDLLARSNFSLAKLNYQYGNLQVAKKRLLKVLAFRKSLNNQFLVANSYLLLSKINLQNNKLESYLENLEKTEASLVTIEKKYRSERQYASGEIARLSAENTKQQRSLKFNQLTIFLGIAIIFSLGLLMLAFYKNQSARNRSIKLVEAKNKELIKKNKIAEKATLAKNQFLSNITHELRTPVYAVTGLTELLLGTRPDDKQKEYLDSLRFSGEHLLALINNILDFNKLEADKVLLQPTVFNLKSKIETVLSTFSKLARDRNNKLHLTFDETLPEKIVGDHVKLSQVIINLLNNAIRFTENGDIWLRIKKTGASKNRVVIYFEVADTGLGIPLKKQKHIFENFAQASRKTNNEYGGTGLGLPIVRGVLRVLGGEIKLQSAPAKGSKFYFTLTFKTVAAAEKRKEKSVAEKQADRVKWQESLRGKKILIVEDNKINQMITHKMVSKHAAECELADDGETAIEKTKENRYDLILMDINLPGISGTKVTRKIRKTDQKTPILALTAVALEENLEDFLKNGFNAMIPKPYKTDYFFKTLHDQLSVPTAP